MSGFKNMNYKAIILIFSFSLYSLCFSSDNSAPSNLQTSKVTGQYDNKSPTQMNANYQTEMPDTEKYETQKDNSYKIVLGIFCGIGCVLVTIVACAALFSALSIKGDFNIM